jgi:hypothetical protein
MSDSSLFEKGLKVRKEVLGEDYVNKSICNNIWRTESNQDSNSLVLVMVRAFIGCDDRFRRRPGHSPWAGANRSLGWS